MARETDMGGDNNDLFIGEDKIFEHFVVDENNAPVDITGWDLRWVLRLADATADPPLFEKLASIQGVFNTDQRGVVTLTDTEMNTLKPIPYRYSWKRFNDGVETVTGFGNFTPKRVTAR